MLQKRPEFVWIICTHKFECAQFHEREKKNFKERPLDEPNKSKICIILFMNLFYNITTEMSSNAKKHICYVKLYLYLMSYKYKRSLLCFVF